MTTHLAPSSTSNSTSCISVGQRIGNFRLERLLGEGGMGIVFEARHVNTGGRAAIKFLQAEVASRPDVVARLFNEARATATVEHPGIVRIFDCGYSAEGIAYLTMEYVDGESLAARLARQQRLPQSDVLHIGRQVASALRAAHAKGIVHRDLKPDNVMLALDMELPSGERVKVVDFGIAKVAQGAQVHTKTGMVMGTSRYMSPEQCRDTKSVTDRSDVYSLGILLYEMLTGRPPFQADNLADMLWQLMNEVPPPLHQFVPDVAQPVARLIESMLEKNPSLRPSMAEVAQQICQLNGSMDSQRSGPIVQGTSAPKLALAEDRMASPEPQLIASLSLPSHRILTSCEETKLNKTDILNFQPLSSARLASTNIIPRPHFAARVRRFGPLALTAGVSILLLGSLPRFVNSHQTHPTAEASPKPNGTDSHNKQTPASSIASIPVDQTSSPTVKSLPEPRQTIVSHRPTLRGIAEQQFRNRECDAAITTAIELKPKNPKIAWSIIGRCACRRNSALLANQAIQELMEILSTDSVKRVSEIYNDCKKRGLVSTNEGTIIQKGVPFN